MPHDFDNNTLLVLADLTNKSRYAYYIELMKIHVVLGNVGTLAAPDLLRNTQSLA